MSGYDTGLPIEAIAEYLTVYDENDKRDFSEIARRAMRIRNFVSEFIADSGAATDYLREEGK